LLRGRLRNGELSQLAQRWRYVELRGRNRVNRLAERVGMLLDGAQRGGIERHLRGGIQGGGWAANIAFCCARSHRDIFQSGSPLSVLSVGFRVEGSLLLRRHPRRGRKARPRAKCSDGQGQAGKAKCESEEDAEAGVSRSGSAGPFHRDFAFLRFRIEGDR